MTRTDTAILWAMFLVLGAGAGYGAANWAKDRQIAALKVTADSIRVADSTTTASATAFADSMAQIVAAKAVEEQAAKDRAAQASKSVNAFHDAMHAAIADNVKAQVAFDSLEAAHDAKDVQLQNAITAADAKVVALTATNDTLRRAIGDLNRSVAFLAGKVNELNSHKPPTWLTVSLAVVKTGLAIKGGYDIVRGR